MNHLNFFKPRPIIDSHPNQERPLSKKYIIDQSESDGEDDRENMLIQNMMMKIKSKMLEERQSTAG